VALHRFGHAAPVDCESVKTALRERGYIQDELIEVEGLRIYGSPWQPEFGGWAFNLPRGEACR
jgi:hypothetical protein